MNKGGFSWKRLSGVSGAKAKVSRKIGIPLTKSGRNQKIGRTISKGCLGVFALIIVPILVLFIVLLN